MSNSSIGMGEQDQAEREIFLNELQRIFKSSEKVGVTLRVIGSLAFQMHCPKFGYLQAALGRAYTDIDFAGYRKQSKQIKEMMLDLGYEEIREVFIISEGDRAIFHQVNSNLHVDVFYEKLDFSHVISWSDRLEVDSPTIPLAELLLEKMQIFQINEKDIIDTIMLLLEHPLGDSDDEVINIDRIARFPRSPSRRRGNPRQSRRLRPEDRRTWRCSPAGSASTGRFQLRGRTAGDCCV